MNFSLLTRYEELFAGKAYLHRDSTRGDWVAQFLFEDLYELGHSPKLRQHVDARRTVLNMRNRAHGIRHRRGDGSLGNLIPGETPTVDPAFHVAHGPIANIQIGVEVKILAKAMIKQIDRVKNDVRHQAHEFRKSDARAVTVAIVGINHAPVYRSFEGTREYVTDGRPQPHPSMEAAAATAHIEQLRPDYDELLILPFRATNLEPYPFEWVNPNATRQDYGALLLRVSNLYESRF